MHDDYGPYKLVYSFKVLTPPLFVYWRGLFVNLIEMQKRVIDPIVEVVLPALIFGAILRAVSIDPVKRVSFSRLIEECEEQGMVSCVPDGRIK